MAKRSYPKKPTPAEREAQFEQPPAVMPEGMTTAVPPVASAAVTSTDDDAEDTPERSWADLVEGASPTHWGELPDGTKTAGGPIKHSLCPGCIHLGKDEQCKSAMPEVLRNNPETRSCMNARPIGGN